MSINRTLQFTGYAYSDSGNATITASINGTEVFNGTVPTLNQAVPLATEIGEITSTLFTIENSALFPVDFAGSYPMTITVANSTGVYVGAVLSNYMAYKTGNVVVAGTADTFIQCYHGTPTNSEGTPDCRSSVTINGVTQVPPQPVSRGTWTWVIKSDSTLACNLNVSLGNIG